MTRAATTCVIFDCDGTLVDGQASICEAMEADPEAHEGEEGALAEQT